MKLGAVRSKPLSNRESYSYCIEYGIPKLFCPLQTILRIQSHDEFHPVGVNHSRVGEVSGSNMIPLVLQTNCPLEGTSGVPVAFGTDAEPLRY